MEWTQERVDLLSTLWLAGASAREIADRLGGVSRNAVIGKVHRLGLGGRGDAAAPRGLSGASARRPRSSLGSSRSPAALAKSRTLAEARRLGQDEGAVAGYPPRLVCVTSTDLAPTARLMTLQAHSCRWPVGHPEEDDFGFCGRERDARASYCAHHSQLARRRSSLSNGAIEKLAAIR